MHAASQHASQNAAQAVQLKLSGSGSFNLFGDAARLDRRRGRRLDYEQTGVRVDRWEGSTKGGRYFGELMDLSSTGVRVRVRNPGLKIGAQVRIQLCLPIYAGISPFVTADGTTRGSDRWTGSMTVVRLIKVDSDTYDVAGRLADMREVDRGMLGLYLSAQPLAA